MTATQPPVRPPMRVLIVSGALPPVSCGVGDYSASLARSLSATGLAQIAVLTSSRADRTGAEPQLQGIARLEPISDWRLRSTPAAIAAVEKWQPDLLHIQFPSLGYDGPLVVPLSLWFRLGRRRPVVLTQHEKIVDPFLLPLIHSASAVVVVRPELAREEGGRFGFSLGAKARLLIPNAPSLPLAERTPETVRLLRERYRIAPGKAIVAYFGFLYPARGVDQLFEIASPEKHHLLIAGGPLAQAAGYHDRLTALAREPRWRGSATLTGFVPEREAAAILAGADAVVLPFLSGGGTWSTSIQGARLQGTFVLTTSTREWGYDPLRNLYCARPGDLGDLRAALDRHLGTRLPGPAEDVPSWDQIARRHLELYASA